MMKYTVPEVDVVAVADADEAGLEAAGERTGAARAYADYRDMLQKEEVDLVNIGPRAVGERVDMVTASAEAGVRGIFCEKPMAATLREADAMLEVCQQHGARMAVAHRRANPYEQHAKKLVESGEIGELQVIRAHGKWDRRSGAQDLAVLGTHMMDSMRYLAGAEAAWAHGHVMQDGREVTDADTSSDYKRCYRESVKYGFRAMRAPQGGVFGGWARVGALTVMDGGGGFVVGLGLTVVTGASRP